MLDAEPPTIYNEKWRKANKKHVCCECRGTIDKGERYHYLTGIWEGHGATYKTCVTCDQLRRDVEKELNCSHDDLLPLGQLYDVIGQCDLEVEDGILV